ncbi:MAG: hypothetical protein LQ351_003591 [Letrouitia transgressa]|nr:MAG: hypothetical protein LQ351_003591 [Letrouitia transgressa]
MEVLAEHEKYTSFKGLKDTTLVLVAYAFLTFVERACDILNHLPLMEKFTIIGKKIIASLFPYLAEEAKAETIQMPIERNFDNILPRLADDLVEHAREYGIPAGALEWYRKSLNHNVSGGKANRGKSVMDTTSQLLGRPLTDEEFFKSATLGWCTELLQAALLVADDMMDSSKTRRGSPCWYLMPDVGMTAMNDAFMLVSSVFVLLKKYFREDKCYINILEIFHEVMFKTEIGQLCDLITAPEDRTNFEDFSFEKYRFIVEFKTAYYSFFLPAALSLYFLNLATPKNLQQTERILLLIGEYFQVQDDYLDNFGVPEIIGKIGTDIQDNKCSWLINEALKRSTAQQRQILEENYGQKNADAEAKVKAVYEEMDLDAVYKDYEAEKVRQIRELINSIDESEGLKKSIFEGFLDKIYKRTK